MPGPETIRDYLDTVTAQIRWKRARAAAVRELETHLEDQRKEFQTEGHPPEEAERLAVERLVSVSCQEVLFAAMVAASVRLMV